MKQTLSVACFMICCVFPRVGHTFTISIDFEESVDHPAVVGTEATNLYASLGVRFPSRPTIERDLGIRNQVLQQGNSRRTCIPLEIELNYNMVVHNVSMRVVNRHLTAYKVEAFMTRLVVGGGGPESILLDEFSFAPAPRQSVNDPPFITTTDVTLRADANIRNANIRNANIHRIVVHPPSNCSAFARIDDLTIETEHQPIPIGTIPPDLQPRNSVGMLAYEVNQGVMSRLTWAANLTNVNQWAVGSSPDTRMMASPEKHLPFISGRDTGVRFFPAASRRQIAFEGHLEVRIAYRDGTSRFKLLTEENTIRETTLAEDDRPRSVVPVVRYGTTERDIRRSVLMRRAAIDKSIDYVIPGEALRNANRVRLDLWHLNRGSDGAALPREHLARIVFVLEGPYLMGFNYVRVVGEGGGVFHDGFASSEPYASIFSAFVDDLYPLSGVSVRKYPSPIILNRQFDDKDELLRRLVELFEIETRTVERTFPPEYQYWANIFLVKSAIEGSNIAGLGFYQRPNAFVDGKPDNATHEIGHTMNMDHVSNLHGEEVGGWEGWPYLHGSIGTIDEGKIGHEDGVFGLIMKLATPTVDQRNDWGMWHFSPIAPCQSNDVREVFPECSVDDGRIVHDHMSFGPGVTLPIYLPALFAPGTTSKWISDINYYRIIQFMKSCVILDPEGRSWGGPFARQPSGTSNNPNCRAAAGANP